MALQVNQAGDGRRNLELGKRMDPRETLSNDYEFRRLLFSHQIWLESLFIKIAFYRLNCNLIFINSL